MLYSDVYVIVKSYVFKSAVSESKILNDEKGKPVVHFLKDGYNIEQIDISLSHLKEYAIANCIIVTC